MHVDRQIDTTIYLFPAAVTTVRNYDSNHYFWKRNRDVRVHVDLGVGNLFLQLDDFFAGFDSLVDRSKNSISEEGLHGLNQQPVHEGMRFL